MCVCVSLYKYDVMRIMNASVRRLCSGVDAFVVCDHERERENS